jgi:hypothetical protein
MECWGAQGGNGIGNAGIGIGGKGGYSKGYLSVSTIATFYIYVGGKGENAIVSQKNNSWTGTGGNGGWNGGGSGIWDGTDDDCGGGGGGATDIRTTNGTWNTFTSQKTRIMVSGGGGGSSYIKEGGAGGGLNGGYGELQDGSISGVQATQTTGYKFGQGQSAYHPTNFVNDGGGGGGGYYGGTTISVLSESNSSDAGSGGSGFISGHAGCNAINQNSTSTKITHTGQPNHYSGYVFTNTVMKAGNEVMPSPSGGTETGHSGNGYCKITWQPAL